MAPRAVPGSDVVAVLLAFEQAAGRVRCHVDFFQGPCTVFHQQSDEVKAVPEVPRSFLHLLSTIQQYTGGAQKQFEQVPFPIVTQLWQIGWSTSPVDPELHQMIEDFTPQFVPWISNGDLAAVCLDAFLRPSIAVLRASLEAGRRHRTRNTRGVPALRRLRCRRNGACTGRDGVILFSWYI